VIKQIRSEVNVWLKIWGSVSFIWEYLRRRRVQFSQRNCN